MPVFAIIASDDSSKLEQILQQKLNTQDFQKVDNKTWFVSAPQGLVTPKELSDFLGVSLGEAGKVVIIHVTSYYGYHQRDIWDWLNIKGA